MKLAGNTILVTGGGSGIGQGLAWRFAALGNQVIVAGRTLARLQATIAGRPNMHALQLDVADMPSVAAAAEVLVRDFPQLNMLIQSAGIMSRQELGSGGGVAAAERVIDINLLGTIRVVEALIPQLSGKADAVICTVTSGLGFTPLPSTPAYSASKAAVHSYSLSLRHRLKGDIQVVEIIPPAVQTELTPGQSDFERYMPLEAFLDETMENFRARPDAEENLVANALPLRNAEKEGRLSHMLTLLGGG